MVEAAFVVAGYQLFVEVLNWGGWGSILFAVVAVVPAPIYAGWRSPELSLVLGTVTGVLVCVGMIAYLWTEANMSPCPPLAVECFQYLKANVGTFFALLVVLPAFMVLTPVAGNVFDRLGWRREW